MATISFGGLGNGLDFGKVVEQLVKVAHLPVDSLNEKKGALSSKSTDYATLSTKLIGLQSAADKLRLSTSFDRTTTSVSDTSALSAVGSSTATSGTYAIKVTQLAQSNQITNKAAKTVAATTTDIVAGASGTFTFKIGSGVDQTVTLSDTATLEDLKSAINDLGAGATASIINTGSDTTPAYRLVLTSATTGASNGITIVADNTTLDFTNGSGTGGVDTLQAAQDAIAIVGDPALNPVTVTRSTNAISDAIAGVTLTLLKTTGTSTVQVNVSRDVTAVKDNIKGLATAYNEVLKYINERTTYDVATKKGGNFFGEPTVRGILSQIRTALSASIPGAGSLNTLGNLGFKTDREGTITVDEAKLDTALSASYSSVRTLFVSQTGSAGVAQLLNTAIDSLTNVASGQLTLRKNGIAKQITSLSADILRKEDAVAKYEERLKAQYASLDGLLRRLQSQTSSLQSNSSSGN
ncbi:flagellar filament capping protein FliD [Nitrospira lenta]|uniref:Flagellar hook-associated protein 2 n=1 Tax=Nitrospira lenta TaxID=1436998 RepID=A0A330L5M7_9BACT|nr:flagellar filament capping protein FliD [Nitrospira lenta]SPP65149.1 putative Flagellar capping protein FliD [Nitrospira lenta]